MATVPPLLVARDGRGLAWPLLEGTHVPVYLRDIDLGTLQSIVESGRQVDAVDLDTVSGLTSDIAAARFLTFDLEIGIIATRRRSTACWVAEQGRTALLHLGTLDSTGLERGLTQHPGAGIGVIVSPGPALKYLGASSRSRLARPIVAYGLTLSPATAMELSQYADALIVAPAVAEGMRRRTSDGRGPTGGERPPPDE